MITVLLSAVGRSLRATLLWAGALTMLGLGVAQAQTLAPVKDILPGAGYGLSDTGSQLKDQAVIGNLLFFRADDGIHGFELWASDGTAAGTALVIDTLTGNDGAGNPASGDPSRLQAVNGRAYFGANNNSSFLSGVYAISVDSSTTPATITTPLIFDGNINSATQGRFGFAAAGTKVLFGSSYGFFNSPGNVGRELYGTTGSTATLVADLRQGSPAYAYTSDPNHLVTVGNRVFFVGRGIGSANGTPTEKDFIGVSDGTTAGSALAIEIEPGGTITNLFINEIAAAGNRAIFPAVTSTGYSVLASDGTQAGTQKLINAASDTPAIFATACPGKAVFLVGSVPWVTDGTVAGTFILKQLNVGTNQNGPGTFAKVGNRIAFRADNPAARDDELWVSDCTSAGTVKIDVNPSGNSSPYDFAVVGNRLFFLSDFGGGDPERYRLHVSDLTQAGTTEVLRGLPADGATPYDLMATSTRLFFTAVATATGRELYSVPIPPATPSPTVTIGANPATVTLGSATALTWSSTNATACVASGAWAGNKAVSGTESVTPTAVGSPAYTLTCTGTGGSGNATATVTVNPVVVPAPTVTIAANPTTLILGAASTLTWSSTNATACTASGAWTGTRATSGTASVTPSATGSAAYTLTCTGTGGSGNATATVTVNPVPAPTVSLAVSPSSIRLGASAALTWSSTHAASCSASGAWTGTRATSGTESVTPTATGTQAFTLTCTGDGGVTVSNASLTVNPPKKGGGAFSWLGLLFGLPLALLRRTRRQHPHD